MVAIVTDQPFPETIQTVSHLTDSRGYQVGITSKQALVSKNLTLAYLIRLHQTE